MLEILIFKDNDKKPISISFEEIKTYKQQIKKIIFLYDYNSYLIDIEKRVFIINGGRFIRHNWFNFVKEIEFIGYRRHNQKISLNGNNNNEEISYLIGFKDKRNDNNEFYLHIFEEGKSWKWVANR